MKKLSIILAAIAISGVTYGAQLELKGGFEPWREGNNSYSNFDNGGSLGAELLFNAEDRPFDYGFGMEWKSKFSGGDGDNVLADTKANTFPIYLTGKYGIGNDLFYLVSRAGWSMYDNSHAKDGFYGAAGIGKEFGNFTLEALYETMDLSGSSKMYSGDRANLASIKFGYRFGENRRDVISREKEMAAKAEYEKQQAEMKKLEEENKLAQESKIEEQNRMAVENEAREMMLKKYNSLIVVEKYEINELDSEGNNELLFNDMDSDLAKESGILTVSSYTDNSGSEKYNKVLSQKRADKVADKIKSNLTNENIEVISEGLGETNFLNANETPKERKANRRTEINFIAK
ncbi:MAG: OmpA family protein [Psychrilyobacter sp.]|uniref:OmpA family protein n=1 Tax=Psychrilyobacter sp. TaxID=2586924 RepID=UPI003C722813